jgi:hypothetical protein
MAPSPKWIAVTPRFRQLNANLALTPLQTHDGHTKRHGVISCLNRNYHGSISETDNSFFIMTTSLFNIPDGS